MKIKQKAKRRNKGQIREYILNCIDSEPYDIVTTTDEEKLDFLRKTFKEEYGVKLIKCYGYQPSFINWMNGLPSVFNMDFENHKILELMKMWYREVTGSYVESKAIEMYWNVLYMETNQLLKLHKLPMLGE